MSIKDQLRAAILSGFPRGDFVDFNSQASKRVYLLKRAVERSESMVLA